MYSRAAWSTNVVDSTSVTGVPAGTDDSVWCRRGSDRQVAEPVMRTCQSPSAVGLAEILARATRHAVIMIDSARPSSTPSSRLRNTTPARVTR